MQTTNNIKVTLDKNRSYDIILERDSLSQIKHYIEKINNVKRFFIVTHKTIYNHYSEILLSQLNNYTVVPIFIDEGETSKSLSCLSDILDTLFQNKVERSDCIIGFGGGVIGDLAGFAASICLRGLRLIHIPTTLLAQVDSAIGGKTGINHSAGKNLIGTFYQPECIIIDPNVLKTLNKEEMRSGFAEIIKYGVIRDRDLFNILKDNKSILNTFNSQENSEIWDLIIKKSCQNKVDVVSEDEKEAGIRAILNFGHTIGHAFEAMFGNYDFRHGECVALGMICATNIASQINIIDPNQATEIYTLILDYGFKCNLPEIDTKKFYQKLALDKKIIHGQYRFILPTSIGKVVIDNSITHSQIDKSINFLKKIISN